MQRYVQFPTKLASGTLLPQTTLSKKLRIPKFAIAQELRDRDLQVAQCCRLAYSIVHDCGEKVQRPIFCHERRGNCPICSRVKAVSDGSAVFHRLLETHSAWFGHLVLTFPAWIDLGSREKTAKKCYAVAMGFCKARFGSGVAVLHTWRTQHPLAEPHWHVHFLVPGKGRFKQNVILLRKAWRDRLLNAGLDPPPEVDLWWGFVTRDNQGKLRHWCNYAVRRPILDINEFLLKGGSWSEDWYDFHVSWPKNFRRVRWFGKLSDGNVGRFLDLEAIRRRVKADAEEAKKWYCPHCGEVIEPLKWVSGTRELFDASLCAVRIDTWRQYV